MEEGEGCSGGDEVLQIGGAGTVGSLVMCGPHSTNSGRG